MGWTMVVIVRVYGLPTVIAAVGARFTIGMMDIAVMAVPSDSRSPIPNLAICVILSVAILQELGCRKEELERIESPRHCAGDLGSSSPTNHPTRIHVRMRVPMLRKVG